MSHEMSQVRSGNGRPGQGSRPGQGGQPDQDGQPGQGGQPDQGGQPGQGGRLGQDGRPGQDGQPGQGGRPDSDDWTLVAGAVEDQRRAGGTGTGERIRPTTTYLVCSLPRSGSWLLSFALEDTGLAGHPYPFFCPKVMEYCTATWQLPPAAPIQDYIDAVIKNSMTPNGVLGGKLEWSDLANLLDLARPELAASSADETGEAEPQLEPARPAEPARPILEELLGDVRMIYLERRDKLREVVSFCRALETREWSHQADGQGGWPDGAADFERLDKFFDLLTAEDREWKNFFRQNDYEPLIIEYEEYTRDQDAFASTIRRVLDYLGIAIPDGFTAPEPRQQRQADEASEEIVSQYRAWRARNGRDEPAAAS